MKVDLNLHSTASDGSLSPSALVWAARSGGLDVIAVADHDTCAGVREAMCALPDAMHVIPAVELSTTLDGLEIHILGYFIDPENQKLRAHAEHAISARRMRVQRMLELLRKHNIHVSLDEVMAANEGSSSQILGRPHVADEAHVGVAVAVARLEVVRTQQPGGLERPQHLDRDTAALGDVGQSEDLALLDQRHRTFGVLAERLGDHAQREPALLELADVQQPLSMVRPVPGDATLVPRRRDQALRLVRAQELDADAGGAEIRHRPR